MLPKLSGSSRTVVSTTYLLRYYYVPRSVLVTRVNSTDKNTALRGLKIKKTGQQSQ